MHAQVKKLPHPRQGKSERRFTHRRLRVMLAVGGLILLVLGWYGYGRWVRPIVLIRRTIGAIERRDAEALYRLSHPLERKELGVTREALLRLGEQLFAQTGSIRARRVVCRMNNKLGDVWWDVEWETVEPRPPETTVPAGKRFISTVGVETTREGREVAVTTALLGLCNGIWGRRDRGGWGKTMYWTLCRDSGITGLMDNGRRVQRRIPDSVGGFRMETVP